MSTRRNHPGLKSENPHHDKKRREQYPPFRFYPTCGKQRISLALKVVVTLLVTCLLFVVRCSSACPPKPAKEWERGEGGFVVCTPIGIATHIPYALPLPPGMGKG